MLPLYSVILIVSIRPNFNKRGFVPRSLSEVGTLGTRVRHRKLGIRVRVSNNVGNRATPLTIRTNTAILITKDCMFYSRVTRQVGFLGSLWRDLTMNFRNVLWGRELYILTYCNSIGGTFNFVFYGL